MIQLHQLNHKPVFPAIQHALTEPNGLLAFGGDLSVSRLVAAYRSGIFPWFGEDEPILWWSPDPRGLLHLDKYHCARSLAKTIRKGTYTVTLNNAFKDVIEMCSSIPRHDNGTWITDDMVFAYKNMHSAGHAHSFEVWEGDTLIGGLYGVCVGGVFCGESMFSMKSNASKIAFHYLVKHLQAHGGDFIDCQMQTPHLQTLGCEEVPRSEFLERLLRARDTALAADTWSPGVLTL